MITWRRYISSHSLTPRGAWCKNHSKVELHRHLEGAVRINTVLDLAKASNVNLPHGPSGQLTRPEDLTLDGIRPHVQTLKPFPDLSTLLSIFDHTQRTLATPDAFYRIAKESILDAWSEGIRLLELRYAPAFASNNHSHEFEDVLTAIECGITDGVVETSEDPERRMAVGVICIGVGAMGNEEMTKTVDFYLRNQDRFVGFDMAGAEQNVLDFVSHFERIKNAGGRVTCHASEDLHAGKPENALRAVDALGAERIGHGIQIVRSDEVMRAIRERDVMLEVSVTSNFLTSAVSSIDTHPARKLWEYGIPLCVNTDDPGIMGVDLNNEWDIWRENLGFSVQEIDAMQIYALDRSFLPRNEIDRIFLNYFASGEDDTLELSVKRSRELQKSSAIE